MFKREIKALPAAMAEAIDKSINRLQYVDEAVNRSADREEGDTKPQDISGSEVVKADGSATQAPKRKADKSGSEPMQKVAEEVELVESFASSIKRAIAAHDKGDHQRAKSHLDIAKTARYGMKSTEIAKNKELLDKYKELAKMHEEVELDEQKTPYIVIDTANGNKVVAMASDEKGAKSSIFHAERPPMSIKDKSTLKIVKSSKKQSIGYPLKEDLEITELHMSLLEAHGIEKKMAEKIKKVFDAMSTADKAAFMKSYLKNPKAANEYMSDQIMKGIKAAGGMNMKEEVELDEEAQPKWKVQIGKKHYTVTARNTAEANQKAKKLAAKDGNNGVGGKIERVNEAMDPVDAKALKGKHSERKDKDIDNDGDADKSDEYLHKRRQAISKAMKKEEVNTSTGKKSDLDEVSKDLIGRYAAKAHNRGDMAARMSNHGRNKDMAHIANKRYYGVKNAINKLSGRARVNATEEAEQWNEAVEISHDRYMSSHGKKARGSGQWAFTTKSKGEPNKNEMVFVSGDLTSAAKEAAKKLGANRVYVMEQVELEESIAKMPHGRLKFHMNNKNVPHGSYSWDEMKTERDRRLKAGEGEAYKKAKMSMSEEVELEEARWEYKGDKTYMVGGNLRYDDKIEYKLSKANADILNNYMKQAKSDAERSKVWTMFWDSKETGDKATGPEKAITFAKKAIKEEVELEEAYTINHKTFSSAVQHAKAQVEKQGYTIDDDEWDRKVAMGPKKPGTGKTNRYTIDLMKGGKETRRKLQMQVYYDEGRYELNMYIS